MAAPGDQEGEPPLKRLQRGELAGPREMFDHMLMLAFPEPPTGTEPMVWWSARPPFPGSSLPSAGASTCPRCSGNGDDPDGGTCVMCHGHKTI